MSLLPRGGYWIQTSNNDPFDFDNHKEYDFRIEPIAHSLSQINRFVGHCREPYCVAQHSVLIASYLASHGYSKSVVLYGLMHDASEAFTGDMSGPLKAWLRLRSEAYRQLEHSIEAGIAKAFNLNVSAKEVVKGIDMRIALTERNVLLPPSQHAWQNEFDYELKPLEILIHPVPWFVAKQEFLDFYNALTKEVTQ